MPPKDQAQKIHDWVFAPVGFTPEDGLDETTENFDDILRLNDITPLPQPPQSKSDDPFSDLDGFEPLSINDWKKFSKEADEAEMKEQAEIMQKSKAEYIANQARSKAWDEAHSDVMMIEQDTTEDVDTTSAAPPAGQQTYTPMAQADITVVRKFVDFCPITTSANIDNSVGGQFTVDFLGAIGYQTSQDGARASARVCVRWKGLDNDSSTWQCVSDLQESLFDKTRLEIINEIKIAVEAAGLEFEEDEMLSDVDLEDLPALLVAQPF